MKQAFSITSAEQTETSRESLVSSRKFNNGGLKLFRHSELGSESIPHRKLTVLAGKILKRSWIMRHCPKAWFWASCGFRFAHPTANPLQDDSYDNSHNEPLTPHTSHLTCGAGQRAPLFGWMAHGHAAFTMAEILLSLTIIGVVAAITLPSLTGNINERTWETQRKTLFARMSQAIALIPALNGYGKLTGTIAEDGTQTITEDTAAETFVTSGLSKVLKINNICDNGHLQDCGFPTHITPLAGTKFETPNTLKDLHPSFVSTTHGGTSYKALNTKAVAFESANGESILTFYNPNCTSALHETETSYSQALMCANFIYDLNGKKGPNTVGKDIGIITVLYSSDSNVVAPVFYGKDLDEDYDWQGAISACKTLGEEYRLPNRDETVSMYYNQKLLGQHSAEIAGYWTSSVYDADKAWEVGFLTGKRHIQPKNNTYHIRCVKR